MPKMKLNFMMCQFCLFCRAYLRPKTADMEFFFPKLNYQARAVIVFLALQADTDRTVGLGKKKKKKENRQQMTYFTCQPS